MKKAKLLNSDISYAISKMGHKQEITICDAGLPIHEETHRIDLAIVKGLPRFMDVFKAVISELSVEEIILASELKNTASNMISDISSKIPNVKITFLDHDKFKERTKNSVAIVRTGEATPYLNIILVSGVTF